MLSVKQPCNVLRLVFAIAFIVVLLSPPIVQVTAKVEDLSLAVVSPAFGTRVASASGVIILKANREIFEEELQNLNISLFGSVSGNQEFDLKVTSSRKILNLVPKQTLQPGENVRLIIQVSDKQPLIHEYQTAIPGSPDEDENFSEVVIDPEINLSSISLRGGSQFETVNSRFRTAPNDLPDFTVNLLDESKTADGYLIVSNYNFTHYDGMYVMILDPRGEIVYYKPVVEGDRVRMFPNDTPGWLTYWSQGVHYIYDQNYDVVYEFKAVGYPWFDQHALELVYDSVGELTGMIGFIYHSIQMDVPGYGPTTVVDVVIQEQNLKGEVIWEWHGLDPGHYTFDESNQVVSKRYDYAHANALELDTDGGLLLSNRNLDSITKIDRSTSEIVWRLGGVKSDFVFNIGQDVVTDDPVFNMQHDVNLTPDGWIGDVTIFDNHNKDAYAGSSSRAVLYDLNIDEVNGLYEATLLKSYENNPKVYTPCMGNSQFLGNGNVGIGWGCAYKPNYTEFDFDGNKVFELQFNDPYHSYRAFRQDWIGLPTWPPVLVAEDLGFQIDLYMSWNGSTETKGYIVYGLDENGSSTQIQFVAKTGFETKLSLNSDEYRFPEYYVKPVSNKDIVGPASNEASPVLIGIYLPIISVPENGTATDN